MTEENGEFIASGGTLDRIPFTCECNSDGCLLVFNITEDEATAISESGLVFIVDGCKTPPMPGDVKREQRQGYSLWEETA